MTKLPKNLAFRRCPAGPCGFRLSNAVSEEVGMVLGDEYRPCSAEAKGDGLDCPKEGPTGLLLGGLLLTAETEET